jgi:hypothetical protein
MTDNRDGVLDSAALQRGDHVTVHMNGHINYSGYVEDTIPGLNIVWVRELPIGERKLICTDDCRIFLSQA